MVYPCLNVIPVVISKLEHQNDKDCIFSDAGSSLAGKRGREKGGRLELFWTYLCSNAIINEYMEHSKFPF